MEPRKHERQTPQMTPAHRQAQNRSSKSSSSRSGSHQSSPPTTARRSCVLHGNDLSEIHAGRQTCAV